MKSSLSLVLSHIIRAFDILEYVDFEKYFSKDVTLIDVDFNNIAHKNLFINVSHFNKVLEEKFDSLNSLNLTLRIESFIKTLYNLYKNNIKPIWDIVAKDLSFFEKHADVRKYRTDLQLFINNRRLEWVKFETTKPYVYKILDMLDELQHLLR
jgi:hypothetical protein